MAHARRLARCGESQPRGATAFLQELLALLARLEARAKQFPRPCQCWAVLDAGDSSQDAVYLHSPNPQHDNFPYPFDGVTWDVAPPAWLADFIRPERQQVGRSVYNGTILSWVRPRDAAALKPE